MLLFLVRFCAGRWSPSRPRRDARSVYNYYLTKKDVDQKVKAMEKYTTEQQDFPHPRSSEGIYTLAKFRGMQMNSEYAEAFCLIREFSF